MQSDGRPLRIVWFMLHAGYLRFFGSTVRILAGRGYSVHLAFARIEKDPGDARLVAELAASTAGVTYDTAETRARDDGWRPLAGLVRSLVDLVRYCDPRYADAPALRTRMARKLSDHVKTTARLDPVTRSLTLRVIRSLSTRTSERVSRRAGSILEHCERAIPRSRRIDRYLAGLRPDAVLVTPVVEFASSQVEYVKSAQAAGIPAGVAIASWDNLTGKGLIRVVPDRLFVWNDAQVDEAVEMHGVPRGRCVATGAPKFDEWFERQPGRDYAALTSAAALDPQRPYVLYACSSAFIAPDEVTFVRRWLEQLRRRPAPLGDVGVLVRPHPQNARQWESVDLPGAENTVVWPPHGAQPDSGDARADFFDSLWHSSAVVGINTSALIEAAILGKSVLTPLAPEFAGTQLGTLHFRHIVFENGGCVHVGSTLDGHFAQLEDVLEHGDAHAEQTRHFVERFVRPRGIDRPAAPILADEVEALAGLQTKRRRAGASDVAVRALLAPVALAAIVIGRAAARIRGQGGGADPATLR